MGVFRLAAFVLFLLAGLQAQGWLLNQDLGSAVALIALGLACYVLSGLAVPSVPTRG